MIGTTYISLGLVPNGKRTVSPIPASILAMVPKPDGKNENIKSYGADPVRDTVPLIQKLAQRQAWQGKKLAAYLKGKTVAETVRNNWDFFIKYIQYKKDVAGKEQVRSLRRLVHNASEGGDCDCFVNALAVLLLNQKIDFSFRIASYNGSTDYSHIYIVVPTTNGKYITLDPVVHQFNYEVPFTEKKDFAMRLESLDGIGCACGVGSIQCEPASDGKPKSNSIDVKRYYVSERQLQNDGMVDMKTVLKNNNISYTDMGDVLAIAGGKFVPTFAHASKSENIVKQAEKAVNENAVSTSTTNNQSTTQAPVKPGSIVTGILTTLGILTAIRPI